MKFKIEDTWVKKASDIFKKNPLLLTIIIYYMIQKYCIFLEFITIILKMIIKE